MAPMVRRKGAWRAGRGNEQGRRRTLAQDGRRDLYYQNLEHVTWNLGPGSLATVADAEANDGVGHIPFDLRSGRQSHENHTRDWHDPDGAELCVKSDHGKESVRATPNHQGRGRHLVLGRLAKRQADAGYSPPHPPPLATVEIGGVRTAAASDRKRTWSPTTPVYKLRIAHAE